MSEKRITFSPQAVKLIGNDEDKRQLENALIKFMDETGYVWAYVGKSGCGLNIFMVKEP